MLGNARVFATIPVVDIMRARAFYEDKLGLSVAQSDDRITMYECGGGGMLVLYKRPAASSGEHTLATFEVSDLDATIDALIEKGVMMEQYNMPEMNLVTYERGIVAMGNLRTAWFKDSEGNVLGLGEQQ